MRGDEQQQGAMFSYLSSEKRVSQDHPLRLIRAITDPVLKELSPEFDRLYTVNGRPSIAPGKVAASVAVAGVVKTSLRREKEEKA